MKKRIEEMEKKKAAERRSGMGGGSGFGSQSLGGGSPGGGGGGDDMWGAEQVNTIASQAPVAAPAPNTPKAPAVKNKFSLKKPGMGQKNALMEQMAMEGEVMDDPVSVGPISKGSAIPPANVMTREAIHAAIEETCELKFEADGTMQSMKVEGLVNLLVTDPDQATIKLRVAHTAGPEFQFKCHPKLSKDAFFGTAEPWLSLAKDRAFPSDGAKPLGILKWRYNESDEDKAPIKVTCWPSDQRGKTHVNMEYELGNTIPELENVCISIPVPQQPEVIDVDGSTNYDARSGNFNWTLDECGAGNSSGSLEFALPAIGHDAFFPITVTFTAPSTYCDIQILAAIGLEDGEPKKFSKQHTLTVKEYSIGESD